MLAEVLRAEMGVESTSVEFGCDTDVYRLVNRGERNGVVFYADRTCLAGASELGALALEEFHRRHPRSRSTCSATPRPA